MSAVHRLQAAARRWGWLSGAVLMAVLLGWGSYYVGHLRAQNEALATALDQQRGQAIDAGQTPVVPPADEIREDPEVVEVPGPQGEPGPGPTDEQIAAAVARWCAQFGCSRGPTPAQVAAAVAQFCDANGECRGPAGDDGEPGRPGQPGADAPPITDEEIDAAVARWCGARDECRGPAGADGAPGEDGQDSQVPGPTGPPGPTCPEGWHQAERQVGIPPETWMVCVENGE